MKIKRMRAYVGGLNRLEVCGRLFIESNLGVSCSIRSMYLRSRIAKSNADIALYASETLVYEHE